MGNDKWASGFSMVQIPGVAVAARHTLRRTCGKGHALRTALLLAMIMLTGKLRGVDSSLKWSAGRNGQVHTAASRVGATRIVRRGRSMQSSAGGPATGAPGQQVLPEEGVRHYGDAGQQLQGGGGAAAWSSGSDILTNAGEAPTAATQTAGSTSGPTWSLAEISGLSNSVSSPVRQLAAVAASAGGPSTGALQGEGPQAAAGAAADSSAAAPAPALHMPLLAGDGSDVPADYL